MTYAVKEIFLTLQGEGMQAGRRAVFLRLSGCNLWTGREQDRATAQCNFCDTDFVGMDGENGGRYDAAALAAKVAELAAVRAPVEPVEPAPEGGAPLVAGPDTIPSATPETAGGRVAS